MGEETCRMVVVVERKNVRRLNNTVSKMLSKMTGRSIARTQKENILMNMRDGQ